MGDGAGGRYSCHRPSGVIYMPTHEACYDLLSGMPEWMDVYVVEE